MQDNSTMEKPVPYWITVPHGALKLNSNGARGMLAYSKYQTIRDVYLAILVGAGIMYMLGADFFYSVTIPMHVIFIYLMLFFRLHANKLFREAYKQGQIL